MSFTWLKINGILPNLFLDVRKTNKLLLISNSGYMAPEYAMEGVFSVKTDVFSFGVLVLEIISGKKNTGFYLSEHGQSLLLYVSFSFFSDQEFLQ